MPLPISNPVTTAVALSSASEAVLGLTSLGWTAITAVATVITGAVVGWYTFEAHKLRKSADRQLVEISRQTNLATKQADLAETQARYAGEQAALAAKQAAAQSILTFKFGPCYTGLKLGDDGFCNAYMLEVEGKGYQNLKAIPWGLDPEIFELWQGWPLKAPMGVRQAMDQRFPSMTHVLGAFGTVRLGNTSRSTQAHFRLVYIDAFRNKRWDEFTFYDRKKQYWEIEWCGSGLVVCNDMIVTQDPSAADIPS
jgi:hypothetical protein